MTLDMNVKVDVVQIINAANLIIVEQHVRQTWIVKKLILYFLIIKLISIIMKIMQLVAVIIIARGK